MNTHVLTINLIRIPLPLHILTNGPASASLIFEPCSLYMFSPLCSCSSSEWHVYSYILHYSGACFGCANSISLLKCRSSSFEYLAVSTSTSTAQFVHPLGTICRLEYCGSNFSARLFQLCHSFTKTWFVFATRSLIFHMCVLSPIFPQMKQLCNKPVSWVRVRDIQILSFNR